MRLGGRSEVLGDVDRALPFGLRSALKIFTAVADMIAWVLHRAGIQDQSHYLNDFLFSPPPPPPATDVAGPCQLQCFIRGGGSPGISHALLSHEIARKCWC